ncbi:MAG: DUF3500 domain-containing protein [Planctomycetaceae bacterium]|nr:DUF3500 domain-containing protein [Planctomycetaceae bacterium]
MLSDSQPYGFPDLVKDSNPETVKQGIARQHVFEDTIGRRDFVQIAGAAVATAASLSAPNWGQAKETSKNSSPESLVKVLHDSLDETQRAKVCFAWDYQDKRGLLRTHVSNNWSITDRDTMAVGGPFFTKDQQEIIEALFFGLYSPDWHDRIRKQLRDDAGGYGKQQTIAIFGEPGSDQYEFVMTGRHLTIRCDGNTTDHVAFGGPIFYGHAAQGFNEKPDHPGNVFWPQALAANQLFTMLDGKQRDQALIKVAPFEWEVGFQGNEKPIAGLPVSELARDQKEHLQKVLGLLLEPYRASDQLEARSCLKSLGGLEECRISFYQEDDLGNDEVWDIWRLEGPAFVWHYRGAPHVHVWVNIADSPDVALNAAG